MYMIGYDIGSSSIKAALVDASSGQAIRIVQKPAHEMEIHSPRPGWAEQDPEEWWQLVCEATHELLSVIDDAADVISIGISYQMHGLVLLGKDGEILRPSIIWCDSRATDLGANAFAGIGEERCLAKLLNSPGNFTASKLRWVRENEPETYRKIHKFMLPGDYIAYRLSGQMNTTIGGLSEGILWDFDSEQVSREVLSWYDIDEALIPGLVPICGVQGQVTAIASTETGLPAGTAIGYRAGDQPNNAMSLRVLHPGEIAATGGTSGVVYGVVDQPLFDARSRVNGFVHVNHSGDQNRTGILLCINGAGRMYGWLRNELIGVERSYEELERLASKSPVGSADLSVLPFGNGAERIFENREIGTHFFGLQLNRHHQEHLIRATLEGIAFAFVYGIEILKDMGLQIEAIKVGNDNLFQSQIFSQTVSNLTGVRIEILATTGAIGAALASGYGVGHFNTLEEAMGTLEEVSIVKPDKDNMQYQQAYQRWRNCLDKVS